jgi:hypothetical protein
MTYTWIHIDSHGFTWIHMDSHRFTRIHSSGSSFLALVSIGDPKLRFDFTPWMMCMQGGYDLEGLSGGVVDSFRALLNDPSGDTFDARLLIEEPNAKIREAISLTKGIHGL